MTDHMFSLALSTLASLVAASIQVLGGVNLGTAVYDSLSVGVAVMSVGTGVTVVTRAVGLRRVSRYRATHGGIWDCAALLTIWTTGLSLYHVILMAHKAAFGMELFSPDTNANLAAANAALLNWHILVGITFAVLHILLHAVLKDKTPRA